MVVCWWRACGGGGGCVWWQAREKPMRVVSCVERVVVMPRVAW